MSKDKTKAEIYEENILMQGEIARLKKENAELRENAELKEILSLPSESEEEQQDGAGVYPITMEEREALRRLRHPARIVKKLDGTRHCSWCGAWQGGILAPRYCNFCGKRMVTEGAMR